MATVTATTKLEAALTQAVKDGKVPNAIVYATNVDGSKQYHFATGYRHYGVNDEPIQEDSILMLASQTKLLTTIAALQIVEKGLISLDEDVCPHLLELAKQPILQGFDEEDIPKLTERKNPITLRQLLSHSSGLAYAFLPDLMRYDESMNPERSKAATIVEKCDLPLVAEPGEGWMYSTGIDWAGLLVERLTFSSLEDYMQKNLCRPLGIMGITFWPQFSPELAAKVPRIAKRTDVPGEYVADNGDTLNAYSKDCFGGHGAYAKLGDYLLVLRSLLANDGKLLKPATMDMMFTPQLSEKSSTALNDFWPMWSKDVPGEYNPEVPVNFGLGGVLFMKDDIGKRKKGTLSWSGLVNTFWIVDREAGVAMTFGTQVMPPGDAGTEETIGIAERGVYEIFGVYD